MAAVAEAPLPPAGATSLPGALLPEPQARGTTSPRAIARRLVSLDAFRGLAIGGMLLVNNKALGPWTPQQLTHAGWGERLHLADLVWPWFLLIMGVAIPYSAASHRRRGGAAIGYLLKALKRAAILVLLGCLINSSYHKHPMFDFGILQLTGAAYLLAALLYLLPAPARATGAAALLLGYWALLRLTPLPGSPAGALTGPANAVAYLNHAYLARWELENLPFVLPTGALVIIGTFLGDLLRDDAAAPRRKVALLLAAGLALASVGLLWTLDQPMTKLVWTSPYIVFAAGTGSAVLGLCYLLIDVRGSRRWAFPLVVMGVNAITAFVLPLLVNIHVLREWGWSLPGGDFVSVHQTLLRFSTSHAGAGLGGLLYTVSYLAFWWLVLLWMYRKRLYLRV